MTYITTTTNMYLKPKQALAGSSQCEPARKVITQFNVVLTADYQEFNGMIIMYHLWLLVSLLINKWYNLEEL